MEIIIVIPNSFFFFFFPFGVRVGGGGGGGIRRSCSRQCRLSQVPDEIKCDWRDRAADGKGSR